MYLVQVLLHLFFFHIQQEKYLKKKKTLSGEVKILSREGLGSCVTLGSLLLLFESKVCKTYFFKISFYLQSFSPYGKKIKKATFLSQEGSQTSPFLEKST